MVFAIHATDNWKLPQMTRQEDCLSWMIKFQGTKISAPKACLKTEFPLPPFTTYQKPPTILYSQEKLDPGIRNNLKVEIFHSHETTHRLMMQIFHG